MKMITLIFSPPAYHSDTEKSCCHPLLCTMPESGTIQAANNPKIEEISLGNTVSGYPSVGHLIVWPLGSTHVKTRTYLQSRQVYKKKNSLRTVNLGESSISGVLEDDHQILGDLQGLG